MPYEPVPRPLYVTGAKITTIRPETLYATDTSPTASEQQRIPMTCDSTVGTTDLRSPGLTCDATHVLSYLIQ